MLRNNNIYLYILDNINKLNDKRLSILLQQLELNVYSSVLKYKFKDNRSTEELKHIICKELNLR